MPKEKSRVHVIRKEQLHTSSSQNDEQAVKGLIQPDVPFYLLIDVVESSFVVGGVIEKIATRADSGFDSFNDDDIAGYPKEQVDHLRYLLDNMDVQHAVTNMATCGNYRLEVTGGVVASRKRDIELIPFLTRECLYKDDWTLVQNNGKGQKDFPQGSYIQLKRRSLKTRYYGDSIFSKCVRQIVVLDAIDKHYERFFDNGMINTKLIMDVNGELSDADIKIIKNTISDRLRGVDNSFATAIVPAELKLLELENIVDVKGLIEYRRDLIKSISIALNIPYDMLDPQNSNRATSEVSQEELNTQVVVPLQEHLVRQLRKALYPYFGDLVKVIQLKAIDTKNQKEEMDIWTGYKRSGILTANEVRQELGRDPIEGGDVLETSQNQMTPEETNNVNKIKKYLAGGYSNLLRQKR